MSKRQRNCGWSSEIHFPAYKRQKIEYTLLKSVDSNTTDKVEKKQGYRFKKLYTSYLGKVNVHVYDFGNGKVALQGFKNIKKRGSPKPIGRIYVKTIDAMMNKLDINRRHDLGSLAKVNSTIIDIEENKKLGDLVVKGGSKEQLHPLYVSLNPIEIHFLTYQYLFFLKQVLNIDNVDSNKLLVSLHNAPKLDNAFYTGNYMVYGNGDRMFLPMGCADVAGHELAHGLVQNTAGLIYKGESGALNESFADMLGVTFEFWLYRKFNKNKNKKDDLLGNADWLMGEDVGKIVTHLRNMKDPHKAKYPQPKVYKGKYWIDTKSTQDHGGVHSNSGVGNYLFYLMATKIGIYNAMRLFYKCLLGLSNNSNYSDLAIQLKDKANKNQKKHLLTCLISVGLH